MTIKHVISIPHAVLMNDKVVLKAWTSCGLALSYWKTIFSAIWSVSYPKSNSHYWLKLTKLRGKSVKSREVRERYAEKPFFLWRNENIPFFHFSRSDKIYDVILFSYCFFFPFPICSVLVSYRMIWCRCMSSKMKINRQNRSITCK